MTSALTPTRPSRTHTRTLAVSTSIEVIVCSTLQPALTPPPHPHPSPLTPSHPRPSPSPLAPAPALTLTLTLTLVGDRLLDQGYALRS